MSLKNRFRIIKQYAFLFFAGILWENHTIQTAFWMSFGEPAAGIWDGKFSESRVIIVQVECSQFIISCIDSIHIEFIQRCNF